MLIKRARAQTDKEAHRQQGVGGAGRRSGPEKAISVFKVEEQREKAKSVRTLHSTLRHGFEEFRVTFRTYVNRGGKWGAGRGACRTVDASPLSSPLPPLEKKKDSSAKSQNLEESTKKL
jgi:hypothetical protein